MTNKRYCPSCLGGLWKATKIIHQHSWSAGRDLIAGTTPPPPSREHAVLPTVRPLIFGVRFFICYWLSHTSLLPQIRGENKMEIETFVMRQNIIKVSVV